MTLKAGSGRIRTVNCAPINLMQYDSLSPADDLSLSHDIEMVLLFNVWPTYVVAGTYGHRVV